MKCLLAEEISLSFCLIFGDYSKREEKDFLYKGEKFPFITRHLFNKSKNFLGK
jgi:hypothetical protein